MIPAIAQPPVGTPLNWNHSLTKGLVGCWLLNEGGGQVAINSANSGRPGILSDGAVFGKRSGGSCGEFLTSSDVLLTTRPSFDQFLTASIWFYVTVASAFKYIFSASGMFYFAYDSINRLDSYMFQSPATNRPNTPFPSLVLNKWYHVAHTYDGAVQKCYLDGKEVTSNAWTGTLVNNSNVVSIGNDPGKTTFLKGYAHTAMLYDRALLPSEIKELYRNPYQMFQKL